VRCDVHGHRAEQHLTDPAAAERANHGQTRGAAGIDQRRPRIGSGDRCADRKIGVLGGDVVNDTGQQVLPLFLRHVDEVRGIPQCGIADGRQVRGVDHVQSLVPQGRLIAGPTGRGERLR
jgi:hypothetical protein